MKISIIGGGNMGGAIARGLVSSEFIAPEDITIINKTDRNTASFKAFNSKLNVVAGDYASLADADVVIIGVKPWMVEDVLTKHKQNLQKDGQLIVSVAATISLSQLEEWTSNKKALFRVIPNTAIELRQSMTFIASKNASVEQDTLIQDMFSQLGKAVMIEEKMVSAVTSLASCGIAFAFRYIRAAMEGGVEMGIYPNQAKDFVLQTLRGAIDLIEANGSHPEAEIDKVTTPGGITIKGLNEMEHAGFTSAVIRGLKASNVK